MIVRIMGEGQWKLADGLVDQLNEVDTQLEQAVDSGDEQAFSQHFGALLALVRAQGEKLHDGELDHSDLILPPGDSSLAEVRELISGDGLVAG